MIDPWYKTTSPFQVTRRRRWEEVRDRCTIRRVRLLWEEPPIPRPEALPQRPGAKEGPKKKTPRQRGLDQYFFKKINSSWWYSSRAYTAPTATWLSLHGWWNAAPIPDSFPSLQFVCPWWVFFFDLYGWILFIVNLRRLFRKIIVLAFHFVHLKITVDEPVFFMVEWAVLDY